MSLLITFYEGTDTDHRGRNLSDILGWDAGKLESAHDYIQTVFPLPEESGFQWNTPTINRQVFDAFRARPELRDRLKTSFKKILWFYGFELVDREDGVKVCKGRNYNVHSSNWDTRFNHNHLRITRIIRCLRVLGLENEAQAFYSALEQNTQTVSSRSRQYWRRAAERTLNVRPDLDDDDIDGDDDLSVGPLFLREFEELRKHVADLKKPDEAVDATKATETIVGGDAVATGRREQYGKEIETEAGVKGTIDTDSAAEVATAEKAKGMEENHTDSVADGGAQRNDPDQASKVGEKHDTAE